MKCICLYFAVTLFFVSLGFSQAVFQKTIGSSLYDNGYSVIQSNDHGYVIAGITLKSQLDSAMYLIKFDSSGNLSWTRTFVRAGFESLCSVKQVNGGDFVVAGKGWVGSFSTGIELEAFLIRIDQSGNIIWSSHTESMGAKYPKELLQKQDGSYLLVGTSDSLYNNRGYVASFSSSGSFAWDSAYGGDGNSEFNSACQTSDGFVIVGSTNSFGMNSKAIYVVKIDNFGGTIWTKIFGDSIQYEGNSILKTNDNGFLIVGSVAIPNQGSTDIYLLRLDSQGNKLWSESFGGALSDFGNCIFKTDDLCFIIAGGTYSFGSGSCDAYLTKIDSNGHLLWSKCYGGIYTDWANSVMQCKDGGYVLTGIYHSSLNSEIYLIKTDSVGKSGCNEADAFALATTRETTEDDVTTQTGSPPEVTGGYDMFTTFVDSGGIENTFCSNTGIDDISSNHLFIYPNPNSGWLNFRISNLNSEPFQLLIYDDKGVLVNSQWINSDNPDFPVEVNTNLVSGPYFIMIQNGGNLYTEKIIIQKP